MVCTALAFVVFFALIREVGAARALVFTYVNPAVALAAGVTLLSEPLTWFHSPGWSLILERFGAGHAPRRRNNRTGRVALTSTVAAVEFNLAEVFEAVAAAVPDRDCIVFGDRLVDLRRDRRPDGATGPRVARLGPGRAHRTSGLAGYPSGQDHLGSICATPTNTSRA